MAFFRDPLFKFILIAFAVYCVNGLVNSPENDQQQIIINEENLLNFMQFRSKTFQPTLAKQRLDSLNKQDLERLIDEYIEQEALYREALSLGLDKNDDIIRRRLIQKIEFIAKGFSEQKIELNEQDLRTFYQQNPLLFEQPAIVSFQHIFYDRRKYGGFEEAEKKAQQQKQADDISGDRFVYLQKNYIDKPMELIESHFGQKFAKQVFSLEKTQQWQGPIRSEHGVHLVKLIDKTPARLPSFEEALPMVSDFYQREQMQKKIRQAFASIVDEYDVVNHYPSIKTSK